MGHMSGQTKTEVNSEQYEKTRKQSLIMFMTDRIPVGKD